MSLWDKAKKGATTWSTGGLNEVGRLGGADVPGFASQGGGGGGDQWASKTYAKLHRRLWDDYMKRFPEYEEKLIEEVTGDQLTDRLASAEQTVTIEFVPTAAMDYNASLAIQSSWSPRSAPWP